MIKWLMILRAILFIILFSISVFVLPIYLITYEILSIGIVTLIELFILLFWVIVIFQYHLLDTEK